MFSVLVTERSGLMLVLARIVLPMMLFAVAALAVMR